MPDPKQYSTEKEFMGVCVPKMMNEGKPNDEAVAACMSMWEHRNDMPMKGWVTINGNHVLIGEDASGDSGSSSGNGSPTGRGWSSPREEFRFLDRRLAAGNLKPGERKMIERRQEKLAKEVYGVNP